MADDAFTPTPTIIDLEDTSSSSSRTSAVYQYFTYKTSRHHCNFCSKNFSDKSTTTLWRHLNNRHPNVIVREKEKVIGDMDKFVKSEQKENVSMIFILINI